MSVSVLDKHFERTEGVTMENIPLKECIEEPGERYFQLEEYLERSWSPVNPRKMKHFQGESSQRNFCHIDSPQERMR